MSKGNSTQAPNKTSHVGNKHEILRQNLNDLNVISERLLGDMRVRNYVLQKGLNESKNNATIVTNLRGGCK